MRETKITRQDNGQTFTFPNHFLDSERNVFDVGPDKIRLPLSGPLQNIGNDFDGVGKVIPISGTFYFIDEAESVVTGGENPPLINKPIQMKYWLESLADGSQRTIALDSYISEYSLVNGNGTTVIDGVEIPGTFKPTTGYIDDLEFSENDTTPLAIDFSFNVWVAGN